MVPVSKLASPLFSLSRLIVPVLCVSLGVSVGSAAGLTLALVNAPNDTVAASSAIQLRAAQQALDAVTSVASANAAQPAAIMVRWPPDTVRSLGNSAVSNSANVSVPAASSRVTANVPSKIQIALNKTPDAVKPAMFRLGGKEWHVARPVAVSVAQPVQHGLASSAAAPTDLDTAQSGLDAAAKPAALYTEGDLTVADFDATDGTLQASDGRTFVLGTTVAASYATSWDSYHSLVHYRCDQAGSCVLMRAGAVAPNARLI